ncbi:MAG TPA: hypothetical protein VE244_06985 [Nitrososphaeraceae archaeon]|nr:hypothetical protein [Nitrososphaeraceae archaeon]
MDHIHKCDPFFRHVLPDSNLAFDSYSTHRTPSRQKRDYAQKTSHFCCHGSYTHTLYDWARVPMNLTFGIPFWDHWFDWGASILGSTGTIFTYENLTAGLAAHILRGWSSPWPTISL